MERARRVPSWRRQRSLFPVTRAALHLDHAQRGPISTRVIEALARWAEEAARPQPGDAADPGEPARERVRLAAATLLAAEPDEVAFVSGAPAGLALLLEGVDWRPGDQLVFSSALPSSALPAARQLAARDVELVQLRLPSAAGSGGIPPREIAARTLELVEKSLTGVRTRMLLLPAVSPHDGARLDLCGIGSMCRDRGVLLAVDASLALGALPLAPAQLGVDFLVADAHRWLGSIEGTGLLYCHAGVASCVRSPLAGQYEERGARRFEAPRPPDAGIAALGAALALVLELGLPNIAERILELGAYLAHGLQARGHEVRSPSLGAGASGIVCCTSGARWTAPRLRARLARRDIQVGLAAPPLPSAKGGERPTELPALSPHFYNDHEDLDRLLEALSS